MEEKEMIQEASNHLATLETEIRTAYREANEFSLRAKETAREAVLRMADCGQLILLAKEHVRGNRQAWLTSLGIEPAKASKAVYLAKNRDQLELDLWPADMAKLGAQILGILPPPSSANRQENDPERTTASNNSWFTLAGKLQKAVKELVSNRPVSKWRQDERENLRLALKPLVDLYESIR